MVWEKASDPVSSCIYTGKVFAKEVASLIIFGIIKESIPTKKASTKEKTRLTASIRETPFAQIIRIAGFMPAEIRRAIKNNTITSLIVYKNQNPRIIPDAHHSIEGEIEILFITIYVLYF